MGVKSYPTKTRAMTVEAIKERLHLRIEQADEKLLGVLSDMAESLFKAYQSDEQEEDDEFDSEAYEANLKPMTVEELIVRSRASDEDIAAGRLYDIDEVMKELA